jgi:D-sedoheptulose 7-phosphate isomerase
MEDEFDSYYSNLIKFLGEISKDNVNEALGILKDAKENNKNIFIIGNGGSAASAEHYANDFLKLSKMRAFALTNVPTISALGNDIDYGSIFSEQLKIILNEGDVVIGITGSGNSMNIVNALEYARNSGGKTIGILGFDGGKAKEFCDVFILIPSKDYGIIEDAHMTLCHYLSRMLKK